MTQTEALRSFPLITDEALSELPSRAAADGREGPCPQSDQG